MSKFCINKHDLAKETQFRMKTALYLGSSACDPIPQGLWSYILFVGNICLAEIILATMAASNPNVLQFVWVKLTTKSQLFSSKRVIASAILSIPVHAWKKKQADMTTQSTAEINKRFYQSWHTVQHIIMIYI